jgi:DNA-binding CsgD family transcriptional regulator
MIHTKYLISQQKYDDAMAILETDILSMGQTHYRLFVGLWRRIQKTVVCYRQGNLAEALKTLKSVYSLASPHRIVTPIIEAGWDMRELTGYALKHDMCGIPAEWLKYINKRSSIYYKNLSFVSQAAQSAMGFKSAITLTEHECALLTDLYHGLTRSEIAANHYISINTLKTTLQNIYSKLGAKNNIDAVRIALEKRLIAG